METYRLIIIIVVMGLCIADLLLTAFYVYRYKQWQPNKPYKLIELNPILVFLWNNLGFTMGMIVGSIILLTLNFIIAKNAYWMIPLVLIGFLVFTLFNHAKNISLLFQLIEKYPLGHLPEKIFGSVVGNN